MPESNRHPPSDYAGEELCPRCGLGAVTGFRYSICVDGYSCRDTCQRYNYADLCAECDRLLDEEYGDAVRR